jgi:murein L,D-transpeptidase YcbB/YkuD
VFERPKFEMARHRAEMIFKRGRVRVGIDEQEPLPVSVVYFTAVTRADGTLVFLWDVYHRDGGGK